jgi:hypothetical protein
MYIKQNKMTRKEELDIFDTIDDIKKQLVSIKEKVEENNIMLQQIIQVFRYYLKNANQENENDFERNIMANMISNLIERFKR